jgi:excinuclease ABC subunit B
MQRAIDESNRRRQIQLEYNTVHNITPASIQKDIDDILGSVYEADYVTVPTIAEEEAQYLTPEAIRKMVKDLEKKMKQAARKLEFEEAALLRDEIRELEQQELEMK